MMKKKDTDLWLVRNRASGKVKVATRCVVVPPSPTQKTPDDDEDDADNNNNPLNSPTFNNLPDSFNAQKSSCTSPNSAEPNPYTRNRSTTRSWPVIYRNNSLSNQSTYLEPSFIQQQQSQPTSKTEQLQSKRKSTHQYDFDQIFGLNNANYQQYLSTYRKASNCEVGFDKSPSIYDMQHPNQETVEQTQTSGFCSAPPTVIFLLLTLLMTTSATAMLCAAIMTDHWENVTWDIDSLEHIVNQSMPSKVTSKLEILLNGKVARLPFKGELLSLQIVPLPLFVYFPNENNSLLFLLYIKQHWKANKEWKLLLKRS